MEPRLERSFWLLRLTFGLVPIVAGLDKFTNLLTDWTQYLSPLALALPISAATLMGIVGVIEVAAGLLVLSPYTRFAAYVVSAWLALIAVNLATTGHFFDVAVRDLVLAGAAYVLAQLAEVRQEHAGAARTRVDGMRPASALP
jgi:uncharacterized membrane protein YphA (DoxX/SURF4 family)